MAVPRHFHIADFDAEVKEIENNQGHRLYKQVDIAWTRPRIWKRDENAPVGNDLGRSGQLYALVRDHHRAHHRCKIEYIGLTRNLKTRFANHPVARELAAKRGDTALSIGFVDLGRYRSAIANIGDTLEELEHILIWTLWPEHNQRKTTTLPGMGAHHGHAWHIVNGGFRFAGQMPRELAYPWIIMKPGRDRSRKRSPD